ncbi:MAG TPA: hypothetical protein VH601_10785 [Bryobacteraceae bacterium]
MPRLAQVCATVTAATAFAALTLFAADPWKGKDVSTWTSQDVKRVLTDSPWVQQAAATFSLAAEEPPEVPPPVPAAAPPGLGGPVNSGPRWDGGVGRSRGSDPTLSVLIRWDSALPVREALQRSSPEAYIDEHAAKDYIISIVGLVPGGRYRSVGRPASDSRSDDSEDSRTVDARNPEEMLEALMTASRLTPKDKPAISPEDAKLDASTGTLHIFFPRTEPITSSDKEVIFTTRFGALTIQKRFRLKDMSYRGKLEL